MYEQLETKVKQCEELRQLYLKTKNINFAVLLMEELGYKYKWYKPKHKNCHALRIRW